jgi:PAS domain S-box-containing protein
MRALPYHIGGGSFSGSVLSFINISALKSVQLELEEGQAQLSQQIQLYETLSKISARFHSANATIDEIAGQVVDLVPQAYANTTKMTCRLDLGERVYTSKNFKASACRASQTIHYGGNQRATLTAYDLSPEADPDACNQYEIEANVLRPLADRLAMLLSKLDSENKLLESEAKFRMLTENVQDVFWMRSPALDRLTYVSPACEKIWGVSSKELEENPSAFIERIHPEDRQHVNDAFSGHATGQWDVTYRIAADGDGVRWVHDCGFPIFNTNDELTMMCGFARDVTDRKEKEKHLTADVSKLRSTFERVPFGMVFMDMKGRPVESNRALHEMLGYSAEELKRMTFAEFTHPEDVEEDLTLYAELVEGRRDSYSLRKRYLPKQGEAVYANLTVSLVRDEGGQPSLAIGLVQKLSPRGCLV